MAGFIEGIIQHVIYASSRGLVVGRGGSFIHFHGVQKMSLSWFALERKDMRAGYVLSSENSYRYIFDQ
jgi:hypothetical protein